LRQTRGEGIRLGLDTLNLILVNYQRNKVETAYPDMASGPMSAIMFSGTIPITVSLV